MAKTPSDRVELFRSLKIGKEERLEEEAGSRAAIELGSQVAAVAAAMFAGNRGGLPLAARSLLATARGITLALSGVMRLLAGSPAIGAAILAAIAALVVWGLLAPNAVLGALLPTLIALAIALGYILLNYATGALEPDVSTGKRLLGLVLLVALPVIVLVAAWGDWWPTGVVWEWARGAFERHVDEWATAVALAFAGVAAAAALARVVLEFAPSQLRWRRRVLAVYRLGVVGALVAFGVGVALARWRAESAPGEEGGWEAVADERTGLLLFAALLAAALLAGILVEVVIPAWRRLSASWRIRSSAATTRDAARSERVRADGS